MWLLVGTRPGPIGDGHAGRGEVEAERAGLFVGTLKLARRVFPKTAVSNHKLDGAHDALVDVKGLYAVFERMLPSLPRSTYRRIDGR